MSPDFDFATLDPADEQRERLRGWVDAVCRGFRSERVTDDQFARWVDCLRSDEARVHGAWLPEGAYGAGRVPVATYSSLDGTLNTGSEVLPLWMITDITVSPAHRRRGLLRRMITEDLDRAVASGAPMAALTASEGAIYGRFGFGVATQQVEVVVDTTSRFQMRQRPTRRLEMVHPADAWDVVREDFAAFHARTRGSVSRPADFGPTLRGEWDLESFEPDRKLLAAICLDDDERPEGHVVFRPDGTDEDPSLKVLDLIARTPQAHLALWQLVADVDLAERARAAISPTDPLAWALEDPRCVRVERVADVVWIRVLDLQRCLAARPWWGIGRIVLGVEDPLGHAGGPVTVEVRAGVATVLPGGEPEVRLDVSALSSLYLGTVPVATLAAAGRITGPPAAIARLGELADGGPAPYAATSF